MLVLAHLEARHLDRIDVDDHSFDHRDLLITGQRVLPGFQRRMPGNGVDQVHLAGLALILLEGGDPLRIGRPLEHGAIAHRPAGVIGGVAVILDAVGRQLLVLAGRSIADPQVVIADKRGQLAIGRQLAVRHRRGPIDRGALRALHVAGPLLQVTVEREGLEVGGDRDLGEGEARHRHGFAHRCRQRRRHRCVIECRRLAGLGRVDEDELGTVHALVAIPEPIAGKPVGLHRAVRDQRVGVVAQELFRAHVVVHGDGGA